MGYNVSLMTRAMARWFYTGVSKNMADQSRYLTAVGEDVGIFGVYLINYYLIGTRTPADYGWWGESAA